MPNPNAPVIIKKVIEEAGHGHHGGAWKVAYADFVTAMMAFFLMLWLLSTSSEEQLAGLAEFFSEDGESSGEPGGVGGILSGTTPVFEETMISAPVSPFATPMILPPSAAENDSDNFSVDLMSGEFESEEELAEALEAERQAREEEQFEEAKAKIVAALEGSPELNEFADSLLIDKTEDGLRIQIVDGAGYAMFPGGSSAMFEHTQNLINVVAQTIKDLPNKLSIRGHTDSTPFAAGSGSDNWTLSADRANATRKALTAGGISTDRIAEVIGKADSEHLYEETPRDPRNRRISLVLLKEPKPIVEDPQVDFVNPFQ